MKRVAIIGAGPTGVYTLFHILRTEVPLAISIYEQGEQAGVGMPYGDDVNSRLMLANIASIEIPPIGCTYLDWLREQDEGHLRKLGVDKAELHERQFLPRILLGEYFRDRFLELVDLAKAQGCRVAVHESCRITDVEALADGVKLWAEGEAVEELFDLAVIATGHVWPDEEEATRSFFQSVVRPARCRYSGVQGRNHGHIAQRDRCGYGGRGTAWPFRWVRGRGAGFRAFGG